MGLRDLDEYLRKPTSECDLAEVVRLLSQPDPDDDPQDVNEVFGAIRDELAGDVVMTDLFAPRIPDISQVSPEEMDRLAECLVTALESNPAGTNEQWADAARRLYTGEVA